MVNNTVNGKKIGHAAGINDVTVINIMETQKEEKELIAKNKATRGVMDLLHAGEFVSIKAYPGGNPNKAKSHYSCIRG